MKKIIMLLCIRGWGFQAWAQDYTSTLSMKDEYLGKSKDQKTAAWILLGGGAVATTVGIITASENIFSSDNGTVMGVVVAGIGTGAMIGSIPLFIASGRNKEKAMQMNAGIKFEKLLLPQQQGFVYRNMPALSVRISL